MGKKRKVEAYMHGKSEGEIVGFYNMRRRRQGDVFWIFDEKHFSEKWMRDPVVKSTEVEPEEDMRLVEAKANAEARAEAVTDANMEVI